MVIPPPLQPRYATPRRRFASIRTILALMLREMATTYGRSPGGYIWAILEPIGAIALLTIIFSLGFRDPPLGTNFPIFYATGMVPFLMFMDISSKTATSLTFSKALLSYPSVTFVDALLGRFILNVITQILVAYIVFISILLIFETRTTLYLPSIALSLAMAAILAVGVGSLNCFLFTKFPIWPRIWSVLTRPLFIISCTLFLFDTIPQPFRDALWYNPLVQVIGQMRNGFYPNYDAHYVNLPYVFGIGLILMLTGLVFLRRYHRDLLYK